VADASTPAPGRLHELVSHWSTSGRPSQGGVWWSRPTWLATLPHYRGLFAGLPDTVDRETIARVGDQAANGEAEALQAFVAAMVWGYGRVGYGAFRTARVLADNPDAPRILCEAARRVHDDGGPDAFAWFAANRLQHLGVAYTTKYLFFCDGTQAQPALILDQLVQRWLRQYALCTVSLKWNVGDYRRYVRLVIDWAGPLEIAPADVEYLIFADAASDDAGGQWSVPPSSRLGPPTVDTDEEAQAVLDALEEAATAFAAMDGEAHPADIEDFERAIRQLRRIVLTRDRVARDDRLASA
jgi:hypothetical protein